MDKNSLIEVLTQIKETLEKNLSDISAKLSRIENELSALSKSQ